MTSTKKKEVHQISAVTTPTIIPAFKKAAFFILAFIFFIIAGSITGAITFLSLSQTSNYLAWLIPSAGVLIMLIIAWSFWVAIQKAQKIKSGFLSVAAHRLRTPLTRLGWMLASIADEVESRKGKELVEVITKNIKELVGITNQLLDASEAGKESLYYDYVYELRSFGSLVRGVVLDYAVGVGEKDLSLSVDISEELPAP